MITHFVLTGDCHGDFTRFKNYPDEWQNDETLGVIILGDAGFNYFLDERDSHVKNKLDKKYAFTIYCVRGNHEARPQDVPGMELIYDENVTGLVYCQPQWPKIRYFEDFGIYWLNKYRVGIIGGAYSVDKYYRLSNGAKWFENEQLTPEEMNKCKQFFALSKGSKFDLMLTHTCPIQWEPTDLFLAVVDQSSVDKSMEIFLEQMRHEVDFNVWAFGHYHEDRIERPHVEQFYKDTESFEDLLYRWKIYDETQELDWWLTKSPNFYMGQ